MSSAVVSARRPSLAMLYNNLKAQSDTYEELENAARLFPVDENENEVEETYSVLSASSSCSPPPRFDRNDEDSESDSDSSSDSDSDIEPMDLSTDGNGSDSVIIYNDTPFIPPRRESPQITMPVKTAPPRKTLTRRRSPPRAGPSRPSSYYKHGQGGKVRTPVAEEESDHDADCESAGDSTDDEYMPSPSCNPRKRSRPSSPSSFRRTCTSPAASSASSEHPNKRARVSPQSRNVQTSRAEIQRVESAEDYNNFVCPVCGWVQRNERIPDFKRHVKTHQRAAEEDVEKGWRCKGVPVSEAADYGLGADAPRHEFLGQLRVGGCMQTFSRRDALKRHLDNTNVSCVGRPTPATEP
ncbi:hypothetical protein B0H15DRAFT_826878 [Mycena belliarum]|uniref:C2H2-type domain-containing protein n=1 Tax=Mycena belliarum TaxID=1033014 RepID=A0AAD6XXS3_9AGAR|nr:hypothetical protein B0H15DRAFT_826878 [Mycena belliae]